jgi:hypothetical protein
VLLAVDPAALPILRLLDPQALGGRHIAIGLGAALEAVHVPLALDESAGLGTGQFTRANALADAGGLVLLTLVGTRGSFG